MRGSNDGVPVPLGSGYFLETFGQDILQILDYDFGNLKLVKIRDGGGSSGLDGHEVSILIGSSVSCDDECKLSNAFSGHDRVGPNSVCQVLHSLHDAERCIGLRASVASLDGTGASFDNIAISRFARQTIISFPFGGGGGTLPM